MSGLQRRDFIAEMSLKYCEGMANAGSYLLARTGTTRTPLPSEIICMAP